MLTKHGIKFVPQRRGERVGRKSYFLSSIFMFNVSISWWGSAKFDFSVSIIFSIQRQTIKLSFDVISDYSNLIQSSVKRFSSWDVNNISKTKDIVIFLMLQSLWVDIKETSWVCKSSVLQWGVSCCWHKTVKMVINSLHDFSCTVVFENSNIIALY
jgi:hypothetical protein